CWKYNIPKVWEERNFPLPEGKDPKDLIMVPENAQYFAALGCVRFAMDEDSNIGIYKGYEKLEWYINYGRLEEKQKKGGSGLYKTEDELSGFKDRYKPKKFVPHTFQPGQHVEAFMGIDGGSTSTKAVLVNHQGEVMVKCYQLSKGNPLEDTMEMFANLKTQVESQGATVELLGVGSTGYAKDILKDVLNADVALVETVAHTQAALHFYPDADVICDVGGQDIKLIILQDGRVKDFKLNTQCSAGNGYFLQSTCVGFGHDVMNYADLAFSAKAMPMFGYGCAVFMQSDIVDFQRQGWKPEEIMAGLANVLPKNIWLYVSQIPNLASLGKTFILQGGTQHNLAAVKSQVDFIESRFKDTRCYFCKNKCMRTFIDVQIASSDESWKKSKIPIPAGVKRLIVGNSCEKGLVEDVADMREIKKGLDAAKKENPNMVEVAAKAAFKSYAPKVIADPLPKYAVTAKQKKRVELMKKRASLRIGIPRILNMYTVNPIFSAYFEALGIPAENLIYSDYTNEQLYKEGAKRGAIDPCFPSKVGIPHVHNMLAVHHKKKPLDIIFCPMIDDLPSDMKHAQSHRSCPTVASTPEAVKAAFIKEGDLFKENNILFLDTFVNPGKPTLLAKQMYEQFVDIFGLSWEENARAVEAGLQAQSD